MKSITRLDPIFDPTKPSSQLEAPVKLTLVKPQGENSFTDPLPINNQSEKNLDYWGIAASTICLLHCLFLPVIITYLNLLTDSLASFLPINANKELFHYLIMPLIIYFAIASLGSGYRLHHRKSPLLFGVLGILLLIGALVFHDHTSEMEPSIINTIGSILLISAHVLNLLNSYKKRGMVSEHSTCTHTKCTCKALPKKG